MSITTLKRAAPVRLYTPPERASGSTKGYGRVYFDRGSGGVLGALGGPFVQITYHGMLEEEVEAFNTFLNGCLVEEGMIGG